MPEEGGSPEDRGICRSALCLVGQISNIEVLENRLLILKKSFTFYFLIPIDNMHYLFFVEKCFVAKKSKINTLHKVEYK